MSQNQEQAPLPFATSTALDAQLDSNWQLCPIGVNKALKRFNVPEDTPIQIVGVLRSYEKLEDKAGDITFHYLRILPDDDDSEDKKFVTLQEVNSKAIDALKAVAEKYVEPEKPPIFDDDKSRNKRLRKIGAAMLVGASWFGANTYAVCSELDNVTFEVSLTAGAGLFVAGAVNKYIDNLDERIEKSIKRKVDQFKTNQARELETATRTIYAVEPNRS